MKWVRGVSLAFGGPVVLIVGGIVWGPLMEWDLTQPQATLIAGFVAGPFLITAAYIAFHGQREHKKTEREKFDEQIQLQKDQARDELQLKRDQWLAEQRLVNARNVRDRDGALFARMLAFYAEFARAVGRTKNAIPRLPVADPDSSWALVACSAISAGSGGPSMVRIRMTGSMAVGTDRAVLLQRFRAAPYFVLDLEIEQVWWCGAVEALVAVEDAVGLRACDLDPHQTAKITSLR